MPDQQYTVWLCVCISTRLSLPISHRRSVCLSVSGLPLLEDSLVKYSSPEAGAGRGACCFHSGVFPHRSLDIRTSHLHLTLTSCTFPLTPSVYLCGGLLWADRKQESTGREEGVVIHEIHQSIALPAHCSLIVCPHQALQNVLSSPSDRIGRRHRRIYTVIQQGRPIRGAWGVMLVSARFGPRIDCGSPTTSAGQHKVTVWQRRPASVCQV